MSDYIVKVHVVNSIHFRNNENLHSLEISIRSVSQKTSYLWLAEHHEGQKLSKSVMHKLIEVRHIASQSGIFAARFTGNRTLQLTYSFQ